MTGSFSKTGEFRQFAEVSTSQTLASASLDFTSSFGVDGKLSFVTFRRDQPGTTTVKVIIDAAQGSNFDTVLLEETIPDLDEFVYQPDNDLFIDTDDEIRITMSNDFATGTGFAVIHLFRSQ